MSYSQSFSDRACCSRRKECNVGNSSGGVGGRSVSRTFLTSKTANVTIVQPPPPNPPFVVPFVIPVDGFNSSDIEPVASSQSSPDYGKLVFNTAGRYLITVNGYKTDEIPAQFVDAFHLAVIRSSGNGTPEIVQSMYPFRLNTVLQIYSGDIVFVQVTGFGGSQIYPFSSLTAVRVGN